jgi:glutamate racemase
MGLIAVVDSGLGGIPYLIRTREQMPNHHYIYCADNRGFPYGTKSEAEIIASFSAMVERVIAQFQPMVIVVACNTASVVALSYLRQRFSIPFVGVVPAVKPAALASPNRRIGILATKRTVEGNYLQRLINEFAADCSIIRYAATDLINAIETDPFGQQRAVLEPLFQDIRQVFLGAGVDTMVLACTHFLLIETLFLEYLGQDFKILDSRNGVARQTERVLIESALVSEHQSLSSEHDQFFLSGPSAVWERYAKVAQTYKLNFSGVLGE